MSKVRICVFYQHSFRNLGLREGESLVKVARPGVDLWSMLYKFDVLPSTIKTFLDTNIKLYINIASRFRKLNKEIKCQNVKLSIEEKVKNTICDWTTLVGE